MYPRIITALRYSLGAASAIVTLLVLMPFAVWAIYLAPRPDVPSGAAAVEGVLEGPSVPSPLGAPVVYGFYDVSWTAGAVRPARLGHGFLGSPHVRVRTATGVRDVTLPVRISSYTWIDAPYVQRNDITLSPDTPVLRDLPGFAVGARNPRTRFFVGLIAARAGQTVLLRVNNDGVADAMWFGRRTEVIAAWHRRRDEQNGATLGLIGFTTLLAVLCFRGHPPAASAIVTRT